jgi:hypothetical protein
MIAPSRRESNQPETKDARTQIEANGRPISVPAAAGAGSSAVNELEKEMLGMFRCLPTDDSGVRALQRHDGEEVVPA